MSTATRSSHSKGVREGPESAYQVGVWGGNTRGVGPASSRLGPHGQRGDGRNSGAAVPVFLALFLRRAATCECWSPNPVFSNVLAMPYASMALRLFSIRRSGSMAKKNFILQGVTHKTHAEAVRGLFEVPDITKVILSVAFVSESGVQQIEAALRANAARVTVYAGIRNDITSRQGLGFLHDIGVKLYTVDTGSRAIIFHPKLYLVRGATAARLAVGSANLTLGGLNNNIEAGMVLDFDLVDEDDRAVVDEIDTQLTSLAAEYPDHVVKVESVAALDEMLASGRLVDEMAIPPPRPAMSATGTGSGDTTPRMKLKVAPLRRALAKAKAVPKKLRLGKATVVGQKGPSQHPSPRQLRLELNLI